MQISGGYSSVVERSLRMWDVSGSIPDTSIKHFEVSYFFETKITIFFYNFKYFYK